MKLLNKIKNTYDIPLFVTGLLLIANGIVLIAVPIINYATK